MSVPSRLAPVLVALFGAATGNSTPSASCYFNELTSPAYYTFQPAFANEQERKLRKLHNGTEEGNDEGENRSQDQEPVADKEHSPP